MNYPGNFFKKISEQTIAITSTVIISTALILYLSQIPQNILGWAFPATHTTTEIQNLIIGGIQSKDTLTTARVTNKATIKVSRDRKLGRFNIGETNLIYEAVGQVEAGIDFNQIEVKNIDDRDKSVTIVLPAPKLSNVYLDIHQSGVIDSYKKGLGKNVERELQDEAQQEALRMIRVEACAGNILEASLEQAKEIVTTILSKAGFQEITILVKTAISNGCVVN